MPTVMPMHLLDVPVCAVPCCCPTDSHIITAGSIVQISDLQAYKQCIAYLASMHQAVLSVALQCRKNSIRLDSLYFCSVAGANLRRLIRQAATSTTCMQEYHEA
eukprot:GHRR01036353.1.p1 GENE.GHRR01036353.1~~GHRR01036353.1.p1  ORF type:complete len:104 (+),score=1.77 GHRR01036353.1:434-745(+)